jgi:hypothetical protein
MRHFGFEFLVLSRDSRMGMFGGEMMQSSTKPSDETPAPEDLIFKYKPDAGSTHKVTLHWKGEEIVVWASKTETKYDEYTGEMSGGNEYVV